jgi:hypothetical protein
VATPISPSPAGPEIDAVFDALGFDLKQLQATHAAAYLELVEALTRALASNLQLRAALVDLQRTNARPS